MNVESNASGGSVSLGPSGAEEPTVVSLDRRAELTRRIHDIVAAAAMALMVLALANVWGRWERFVPAVALQFVVLGINLGVTRWGLVRFGSARAEWFRLAVNVPATMVTSYLSGWPLAIWMLQPLIAVSSENMGRLHATVSLVAFAVGQGGLALIDGVPAIVPVTFTLLSVIVMLITRARDTSMVDMFRESDRHKMDLEKAHHRVREALTKLEREERAVKGMEVELRQAQKLEAVGRLAAGVAHEINTPIQFVGDNARFVAEAVGELMRVVDGYREAAQCIENGEAASEALQRAREVEVDADLGYMLENVPHAMARSLEGLDRVATIVRSMRHFAHPDGVEMVSANLNEALSSTLVIARFEYKLVAEIRTEYGPIPAVECHLGEVNQVFLNLIVNAAHAVADKVGAGGQRGCITVKTRREGHQVVVTVSDDGVGIPQEIAERVFDPFFTTKEVGRGTGQGLTLAQAVVARHGGHIGFVSTPGVGTTFTVRLPVRQFVGGAPLGFEAGPGVELAA